MIFRQPLVVPLQDVDAAGVVFFAHLFRYAHETYEAFMREINQPLDRLLQQGEVLLPLVHAEADYHRPLRHGESLCMELSLAALGEGDFELLCRCRDADGDCRAEVRTRHVARDRRHKKRTRLPAGLYAALQSRYSSCASA